MICGKHPNGSTVGIGSGYPSYSTYLTKGVNESNWVVGFINGQEECNVIIAVPPSI
jgi:hypothetical protein